MSASRPPRPDSTSRDGPVAIALAAVVIATVAIGSLAPVPTPAPAPARIVLPDADPACAEWSDGCRVCRRLPDGPVCSTPGIACTPGQQECLRRTDAP